MPDDPESKTDGGASESPPAEALDWGGAPGAATADGETLRTAVQRAQLAEGRLEQVLAAYRQVKVETEQFRQRQTKSIQRRFEQKGERLLLKFIDILDSFDRALEAAERINAETALVEGIILVRTQLLQTLKEEGLERIPALGMPYDPAISEAVETRPVIEEEHHHLVLKEVLRGYKLNGRVARHSQVVVGEYRADVLPGPTRNEVELIGADEVAGESEEGEAPSLEDIIARAEASDPALARAPAHPAMTSAQEEELIRELFPDTPPNPSDSEKP